MSDGKLTAPAQIGNTIFGVGVSERLVIERAQREHDYQQTPAREAIRIAHSIEFFARLREPAPEFTVGKYTLRPGMQSGRVYIEHETGEGGDFDPVKLEAVIAEFYGKYF